MEKLINFLWILAATMLILCFIYLNDYKIINSLLLLSNLSVIVIAVLERMERNNGK